MRDYNTYCKVGEELRILRTILHQNQKEMAKQLEISPSLLSRIEKGTRPFTTELMEKLLEVYVLSDKDKQKFINLAEKS